ncbi:hypothetical protein [Kitasatospora sp. NPDC015120]
MTRTTDHVLVVVLQYLVDETGTHWPGCEPAPASPHREPAP